MITLSLLVAALAGYAIGQAAQIQAEDPLDLGPSNAICTRKTYPITVTSSNVVFSELITKKPPGVDETTFTVAFTERYVADLPTLSNFTAQYLNGGKTRNVSGTYDISGVLCTPKTAKEDVGTIQLLIHGIGFDSSYWNLRGAGIPENYSYVRAAADAGYTTFRYDRLGTGFSEHPSDTYNVVQAATDAAIAKEVARQLRAGTIASRKFTKIVAVGHSYGSIQTNAITRTDPSLVDHIILTGFTASTAGAPLYLASAAYTPAHLVAPQNFASLPRGYLMTALPQTSQINFLYWPEYTPEAAGLARAKEQPVSHGVLFTSGTLTGPAPDFKGSVAVVTGDKDFIFCSGNCNAVPPDSNFTTLLDDVKPLYPAASNFTAYSVPNVGHGISSHKAAPATYQWIQEYIASL